MKHLLTAFLLLMALCHAAHAKAYFQTKDEMIEKADVVAVITIGKIDEADTKGKTWTYRQSATAKTESVLKGKLPAEFTLHGAETFICAQCPLAKGRYIAFLKKDGELWTGSNWHLSLRPIKNDRVEWYVANDNRYEMQPTPLADVLAEIKEALVGRS